MATLKAYVDRMPELYQQRYRTSGLWVEWANALLERLSGYGIIPPRRNTADVEVRDAEWIALPANCRDALELREPDNPAKLYPFEELAGELRLTRDRFPLPPPPDPPDPSYVPPAPKKMVLIYLESYPVFTDENAEFPLGDYDNLIEAWLRWKIEEDVLAVSHECDYWRSRVDAELRRLCAEARNRVNPTSGRQLIGFMK